MKAGMRVGNGCSAMRQAACGVLFCLTASLAWADILYVHTDHLNTPRLATNEAGQVVWRNLPTTEPFGNSPVEEDPDGDSINTTLNPRFPGQYYDKEVNTHYNYFRDYDPSTGRYEQSDPIGLAGGINTYSYVGGNPLSFFDPKGLVKWTGTAYNFSVIELIGASFTELDLWSECGADGKRWHIIVKAVGPSVGLGVRVVASISDVSFDDGEASANPDAFNGWYKGVGAGITFGGIPIKSAPSVGFGKPGIGISQGIGQFGSVTSNFSPDPSAIVGRDFSISGTIGSSTVTFAESKDCKCKN